MYSAAARLKTHLSIAATNTAEDELLVQLIDAATQAIKNYCKQDFERAEWVEYHDGTGQVDLLLRRIPVARVLNVWLDATGYYGTGTNAFADATKLTEGDGWVMAQDGGSNDAAFYRTFGKSNTDPSFQREWDADGSGTVDNADLATYLARHPAKGATGVLRRPRSPANLAFAWPAYPSGRLAGYGRWLPWPCGMGNIKVNYVSGYTQEEMPEDLRYATDTLAAWYYRTRKNGGMPVSSEHLGEYGVTYMMQMMQQGNSLATIGELLRPYIDRAV